MLGVLMSILAGAAMSVQGVMNTRLSEKIGLHDSNMFVQGTAFILALIVMWTAGKGSLGSLAQTPWFYWLGGVLGLVITLTVMLGIGSLSPAVAVSIILISQLLVAALIDALGLMGAEKVPFTWRQFAGAGLMIAGVLLFKWQK